MLSSQLIDEIKLVAHPVGTTVTSDITDTLDTSVTASTSSD
jgi:hypothetical protein